MTHNFLFLFLSKISALTKFIISLKRYHKNKILLILLKEKNKTNYGEFLSWNAVTFEEKFPHTMAFSSDSKRCAFILRNGFLMSSIKSEKYLLGCLMFIDRRNIANRKKLQTRQAVFLSRHFCSGLINSHWFILEVKVKFSKITSSR